MAFEAPTHLLALLSMRVARTLEVGQQQDRHVLRAAGIGQGRAVWRDSALHSQLSPAGRRSETSSQVRVAAVAVAVVPEVAMSSVLSIWSRFCAFANCHTHPPVHQ